MTPDRNHPPTICLFNVPAHGHTNPTLPVVAELVRRGARVRYFTTLEFRKRIEATGAEFVDLSAYLGSRMTDPNHFVLADRLLRVTEVLLEALLPGLRAESPDLIVYDSLCPWGAALARLLGVPGVASVSTFVLSPGLLLSTPATVLDVLRMLPGHAAERRSFRNIARRLRERYGLHFPTPLSVFRQEGQLNLVYTSRTLQPGGDRLPARYLFIGPSLPERRGELEFTVQSGVPLIYISLGTLLNDAPAFYRACLAAFATEPVQVIMSIGHTLDQTALGNVPANFTVRPEVEQLPVLARAGAFITHGGMNSVHEALACGVPMLLVPRGSDQHLVTKQMTALGAGLMLSSRATPERLRTLTKTLLYQPAFREASARLGQDALALGGAVRASNAVLEMLQPS